MTYNKNELPQFVQTAGKITILTALTGVLVFVVAFLFDAGSHQLGKMATAATSTATTTLTVLNTPPNFVVYPYEVVGSSTSSPTNSGNVIQWKAVAADSNNEPYFLLICSTNASPTPGTGTGIGTVAPSCNGGTQWGVSTGVASNAEATVSTTTTEVAPFGQVQNWYAWVCDDVAVNPRCNNITSQGLYATSSSPFHVNFRPVLTNFYNNGPKNPGEVLTFLSTSSDPDTVGGEDNIYLVVCQTNGGISTTTRTCNSNGLASTSGSVTANATADYTLASIVRDTVYPAYGYLVDQHGHTATANPINQNFTVSNVAPSVLGGDISLNGGNDIELTVEADETTGFTLDVTVTDANSCTTTVGVAEISDIDVAVFRAGPGGGHSTTTCNQSGATYDPNDCYTSGVSSTVWNLVCTASSTSCSGPTDDSLIYECTFPLWFVADPTDNAVSIPANFNNSVWSAGVRGVDDDGLYSGMATTSSAVELISFTALDLLTAEIPYGSLEPGDNTGTLNATTTILSVGNTGLDELLTGESMCTTFSVGNECDVSATSTVPENQQKFASTSVSYGSGFAQALSSSTVTQLELDVNKSTSTSSPNSGITYWGIAVPITITLAGSYEGLNTFIAVTAEAIDW